MYIVSVLQEFDTKYALTEQVLCQQFYKNPKLLIRLYINDKSEELDS